MGSAFRSMTFYILCNLWDAVCCYCCMRVTHTSIFKDARIKIRKIMIFCSKPRCIVYLYIYFRNVRSPSLDPSVRPSVPGSAAKRTCQNLPGACDTSLEPSRQKKLIREKKSRFARAARPQRAKTCYAHYIGSLYLKKWVHQHGYRKGAEQREATMRCRHMINGMKL